MSQHEIIETYWNVKKKSTPLTKDGNTEIIETYWNVKSEFATEIKEAISEIIETYWNVKKNCERCKSNNTGNNRNILECKGSLQSGSSCTFLRNNRNILECKCR